MKILDVPQSGSIHGVTSSRGRFGQYRRTKAMPTQPRTAAQVGVRNNFSTASKAWAGLTDAQRAAWKGFADAHPVIDSLGQSVSLTGAQMFTSVNTLNLFCGLAIQTAIPDGTAIAAPDFSLTVSTAAGLSGKVHTAVQATSQIIVSASPPLSAGRSFNGDFRVINHAAGSNAADQIVITKAQLEAKFGTLVTGQKYFISVQTLSAGNLSGKTNVAVVLA